MDYLHLGGEVMLKYSFVSPTLEFIRHNENISYKIRDTGSNDSCLLRIHYPISENMRGLQHTRAGILSELEFLEALSHAIDVPIQLPVANRLGELVTQFHIRDDTVH